MKNYLKALSLSALSFFGSPNEVKAESMNKESILQETTHTSKNDSKPTAVFGDKRLLSEKELQDIVNAYFAEHGRPNDAAKVQVKENLVEARKEGDIFYTKRLNGRSYSNKALALGTATNDGYITINRYTADGSRVGAESAAEYQKELDSFSRKANIINVVKHESHHALTYLEIGNKLYDCTALQYAEIHHTRELSAARETAFNELSIYKKTHNKDDISDDNSFLLEMKEIDLSSPKISKEEAKAVTLAVDSMYQDGKLGSYDRNMASNLALDWSFNRQKLGKNEYSKESYDYINTIYNNHTINGQKIDVSEFHKNVDCNAFMTYMVVKNPYNIKFDEKDKKEFSEIKYHKVLPQDRGNSSMMLLGTSDEVVITSTKSNFASKEMPSIDKYIQSGLEYNLGYTKSMQDYLQASKKTTAYNQDMEMKNSDLKGYLGFEKSYQLAFSYDAEEAKKEGKTFSREEALAKMRKEKIDVVCGDILSAYLCGKKEQIDKISPDMWDKINKTCPSLKLAPDSSSAKMNFSEFDVFRKEINSNLHNISPNFEQEMQSYYDKSFGKTEQNEKHLNKDKENSQLIQEKSPKNITLQSMREKIASHREDRIALLNFDSNNTEKSQGLRFSSSNKKNIAVSQTQISTDKMKKLQDVNTMG